MNNEDFLVLRADDFGWEYIRKTRERFRTVGGLLFSSAGWGSRVYPSTIERLALITTMANDHELRSRGLWPITPLQFEKLLQKGKIPKENDEYLTLILKEGHETSAFQEFYYNVSEAKHIQQEIRKNKSLWGLTEDDLEQRLFIINAGAEVHDFSLRPTIITGITQVYSREMLNNKENYKFVNLVEKGKRRSNSKEGLLVLQSAHGRGVSYLTTTPQSLWLRCTCGCLRLTLQGYEPYKL